jgi:hypothetical protein
MCVYIYCALLSLPTPALPEESPDPSKDPPTGKETITLSSSAKRNAMPKGEHERQGGAFE